MTKEEVILLLESYGRTSRQAGFGRKPSPYWVGRADGLREAIELVKQIEEK